MKWPYIVLIALVIIIVVGIAVKMCLKKKLDNIDGLGPVRKKGHHGENDIASFGDDEK